MILAGFHIQQRHNEHRLLRPFHPGGKSHGMSYGLSHCGYDVRLGQTLYIAAGGVALGVTLEKFWMPTDLQGVLVNKSSLARQFILQPNTNIEPGWTGYLTLELVNYGRERVCLRRGQPIACVQFQQLSGHVPGYNGKYQNQPAHPVAAILAE